ncbi:MAG TPA: hypothetical protein VMT35_07720 [Ignavibacteriaceae bacterium]|nr:hypothetical protein [Ignavibacteriaceae bacterium]
MKRYSCYMLSLFLLSFVQLNAQSLNELEKNYETLQKEYLKENSAVDSLGALILKRASLIDNEKKKDQPDEDILVGLLSGSATLSNNLEKHQKNLNRIGNDIEQIKKQLFKNYSVIIDSLEGLKASGRENEQLNSEIFYYTGQRLMVSPKIPMLSFNPEKVLKIDLKKMTDPREKTLFKEYLDNALSEVDKLLGNVEVESNEIGQIADLEKKSKKFLEETEFESGMIPRNISRTGTSGEGSSSTFGERGNPGSNDVNVKAYYSLLNQLDTKNVQAPDLGWNRSINTSGKNLDLKDYEKLLKEVKLRLQELKLVLANKIEYQ